jgi:hypothetical protein
VSAFEREGEVAQAAMARVLEDLLTPNFTISFIALVNGGPSSTTCSAVIVVNGIPNFITSTSATGVIINGSWSPPQEEGTPVVPSVVRHDLLGHAGVELVPIPIDQSEQIDLHEEHTG